MPNHIVMSSCVTESYQIKAMTCVWLWGVKSSGTELELFFKFGGSVECCWCKKGSVDCCWCKFLLEIVEQWLSEQTAHDGVDLWPICSCFADGSVPDFTQLRKLCIPQLPIITAVEYAAVPSNWISKRVGFHKPLTVFDDCCTLQCPHLLIIVLPGWSIRRSKERRG